MKIQGHVLRIGLKVWDLYLYTTSLAPVSRLVKKARAFDYEGPCQCATMCPF